MNLDFKDFTVHDPESGSQRTFRLSQRNDQVSGAGIIRALDIRPGRPRGAARVRMINGDERFSRIAKAAQRSGHLSRIRFVLRFAQRGHWVGAGAGPGVAPPMAGTHAGETH